MDKRVLLVGEYLKGERPMTELCREFGISRKSAYKWVGRYQAEGVGWSYPDPVDSLYYAAS